ncbi:MAG: hypothetical protein IPG50_25605 [Myxococcales bacterium]|nr:hypothetical protein [Myxococcales bacterium]
MWRRLVPLVLGGLVACELEPMDEPAGYLAGPPRDPATASGAAAAGADPPGASQATDGANTSSGPTPSPTPPPSAKLATGLAIAEIALFQGVKVTVAKAGAKATRTVPIVAGRDGLVRVYVTPENGYVAKAVRAELHLVSDGKGLPIAVDTKTIAAASSDNAMASTFNFEVPGANLPAGVTFFVQLIDEGAAPVPTATANAAQYPVNGVAESLDVAAGPGALKIMLVPMRYGADGSNRVPDTSPAILEELRKKTLELYPVPAVNITVHDPVQFGGVISGTGAGWDAALASVTQLRMQEKPAADVYYYGVFAPGTTLTNYCTGSCVLGLSNLASSVTDASQRASIGVLYNNAATFGTLPHELGHAHGRRHAPCGGVAGADPSYPYQDGTIGVFGYSIVTKQLKNPGATTTPHDFMSYCGPEWTSDYTFKALFDRGRALGGAQVRSLAAPPVSRSLRFLFDRQGVLTWRDAPPFETTEALGGDPRVVTFKDAAGTVVGEATAHRYDYGHVDGGYFLVPSAPAGTATVLIEGAGTVAAP